MKLNYRNTIYVGLIFFIISMFWQAYDLMIARTLIDKFGLNQTWSGIVMSFDNIMAVILLPVFGALSDKSNNKRGRRTPYIIVGTLLSAFAFMGLAYTDAVQTLDIQATDIITEHYDVAFDSTADVTETSHWYLVIDNMSAERYQSLQDGSISYQQYSTWQDNIKNPMLNILNNDSNKLDARELSGIKDLYYNYLSQRAWEVTSHDITNLIVFATILFIALVSMTIYRSPAVALMPDITLKPLRSKANAIITLMGAFGGILAVYVIMLSGLNRSSYDNHVFVYIFIGCTMILTLGVFLWKVKEPELVAEKNRLMEKFELDRGIYSKTESTPEMTLKRRVSLYFLLGSIFLLFAGYNAVTSKIADYLPKVLNLNFYDFPFIVAQVFVIVMILPVGILSMWMGRKKTVLLGMLILAGAMASVVYLHENQPWVTALVIAFAGVGLTMITVNTYVMVVEMSRGDVGRYTGYYYAASMSAQIFTPIFSGILMDRFGRLILFPYATVFISLALVAMLFVKHGEPKKINQSLLEAFNDFD